MKAKETNSTSANKLDALIWSGLKKGDANALGKLYNIYIDTLILYGLKICNDKNKVMDAIHDLFVDLFKYRSKLSDTDNVEYYLIASLKRKLCKQERVKEVPLQSESIFSEVYSKKNYAKSPEDAIILSETLKERSTKLLKAFETLTKTQRRGLKLRFKENCSYEEIANILDISVASARTTIYRAVKSLRQYPFFLLVIFRIIFF
ncbi:RNA polymerase sigma factor [Mariniflexile sp.]|uniref:RNA polymerase sigma factor n=2 Tax=Flavobacteriaceae TaxID=49546 RepID=UPI0040479DBB